MISKKILCQVWERDRGLCPAWGTGDNLHLHHVKFKSRGGKDTLENLVLLCAVHHRACHNGDPKLCWED